MKQEILEKIKQEAESVYPIWPNKFKDKDEWLPEEIKKLERRAYSAGASRALELMEEGDGWLLLNADSMPERGEDALFYRSDNGTIFMAALDKDDEDYIRGNNKWQEETHWRSLPKPPSNK